MTEVMKVATAIVGVAMVTTMVLPGRQTPAVIDKLFSGFAKSLKAATGQK